MINRDPCTLVLHSTMFCVLLSIALFSGRLHADADGRTIRRPGKGELGEGRKVLSRNPERQQRSVESHNEHDCQEGLGASYSGKVNVTTSGRVCKVWDMDYYVSDYYNYYDADIKSCLLPCPCKIKTW